MGTMTMKTLREGAQESRPLGWIKNSGKGITFPNYRRITVRFRSHAFGEIIRDWAEENGVILSRRQQQTAS
jgi:hypothetical protein